MSLFLSQQRHLGATFAVFLLHMQQPNSHTVDCSHQASLTRRPTAPMYSPLPPFPWQHLCPTVICQAHARAALHPHQDLDSAASGSRLP
jgi:hypothetical protein